MKMYQIFSVGLLTASLALASWTVTANAAEVDQHLDYPESADSYQDATLLKRFGVLFSLNADTDGENTLKIYRANPAVDSWTEVTDNGRWAKLAATAIEITDVYEYRNHIYAAVVTQDNTAELWRIKKRGAGKWKQVASFSEGTQIDNLIKRRTTRYQRRVRRNGGTVNTLFVSVSDGSSSTLYRSKKGKTWIEVDTNSAFESERVVGFTRYKDGDTRYIYAVQEDGQVLRAAITDLSSWSTVFAIEPEPQDNDTENISITVQDVMRDNDKLYITGRINGDDEFGGALYVSEDWETYTLLGDISMSNFIGALHKVRLNGVLYWSGQATDDWSKLATIRGNTLTDLFGEGTVVEPGSGTYVTSMIRYRGAVYFAEGYGVPSLYAITF